jgi:ABC-type spermidine/putrescine transport system permease subunit I
VTGRLRRVFFRTISAAAVVAAPRVALACPVCFGASDSPMAHATNAGILFMLAIVVGVLVGFASFIVYLVRRAELADDRNGAGTPAYGLSGTRPTEGTL